MTFAAKETSRSKGKPVSLYHFQYGEAADKYYGYTDAEKTIVHMGLVFVPIPIIMGAVKASGTLDRQSIEVRTPQNAELARRYAVTPPSQEITLVVWQGHLDGEDTQFLVTWTGRVLGHKRTGNEAAYTVESIATSLRRSILRRHYMLGCPHVLYGPQCKADKEAATVMKTVLSVSRSVVTLATNWVADPLKPKYLFGLASWTTADSDLESASILKLKGASNHQLVLDTIPTGLLAGMTISLSLGCNKLAGLEDDCIVLHDNIHNFGGQPWIPTKNPIGIKNTFY